MQLKSEGSAVGPQKFLDAIRSRTARLASGGSAMRGKGNTGCSECARAWLRELDVAPFATSHEAKFRARLNAETQRLRSHLPAGAQHWGLARKVLNIYLRDWFYTTYLEQKCSLKPAERLLELPLDREVVKALRKGRKLPKFTIKHLTPRDSILFQAAAEEEAAKRGVARVHLDAFFWSVNRDRDRESEQTLKVLNQTRVSRAMPARA
jgi:hypothetical protein